MTAFSISKRQYDIIINQVKKNYPYESGGFVGGKDYLISAILPSFNQDISNKTDVFAFYSQDIERAHSFFNKHGLDYYGTYHSHPKGIAYPSQQDLSHVQKYLFIISLKNFDQPDFAAHEIIGHQMSVRVPLNVISDNHFSVKELHSTPITNSASSSQLDYNDLDHLSQKIEDVFNQSTSYEKHPQDHGGGGDFSTLA
jgi:proteasome lid subunit RPN8/RPN11